MTSTSSSLPDYGVDLYADTLFTTEKMLKEQPELVKKFVAATVQGWTDAVADPEEAAQITRQIRRQARHTTMSSR